MSPKAEGAEADSGTKPRQPAWWSCMSLRRKATMSRRRPTKDFSHMQAANEVAVNEAKGAKAVMEKLVAIQAKGGLDALPFVHPTGAFPDIETLFQRRNLHIRVISAKGLVAARMDGTSDPFIVIKVGREVHRTAVTKRKLDVTFSETFGFTGESVRRGKYVVKLEAWSFDEWHPDDFLGQAQLDLRQLPLRVMNAAHCTAKLFVLRGNGKKEDQDFGELTLKVWTTPADDAAQFISPGLWGYIHVGITPETMNLCATNKQLPAVHSSPHAGGTLYEEPCLVYLKVSLVGVFGLCDVVSFIHTYQTKGVNGATAASTLAATLSCPTDAYKRRLRSLSTFNSSREGGGGGAGGSSRGFGGGSSSRDFSSSSAFSSPGRRERWLGASLASHLRRRVGSFLPLGSFDNFSVRDLRASGRKPSLLSLPEVDSEADDHDDDNEDEQEDILSGEEHAMEQVSSGDMPPVLPSSLSRSRPAGDGRPPSTNVSSRPLPLPSSYQQPLVPTQQQAQHPPQPQQSNGQQQQQQRPPQLQQRSPFADAFGQDGALGSSGGHQTSATGNFESGSSSRQPQGAAAQSTATAMADTISGSHRTDVNGHVGSSGSHVEGRNGHMGSSGRHLTDASGVNGSISSHGESGRNGYSHEEFGGRYGDAAAATAAGGWGGADVAVGAATDRSSVASTWTSSSGRGSSAAAANAHQFVLWKGKPMFVYVKLTYAKQVHRSHLKRLSALGDAKHDEGFVFATVRPLVPRPLEVSVYLCINNKRKGRLISRTSYDMNDMLQRCSDAQCSPETAWQRCSSSMAAEQDAGEAPELIRNHKWADAFALPVLRWPMDQQQGHLRLHVGIADADYRAKMFNIPLMEATDGTQATGRRQADADMKLAPFGKSVVSALTTATGLFFQPTNDHSAAAAAVASGGPGGNGGTAPLSPPDVATGHGDGGGGGDGSSGRGAATARPAVFGSTTTLSSTEASTTSSTAPSTQLQGSTDPSVASDVDEAWARRASVASPSGRTTPPSPSQESSEHWWEGALARLIGESRDKEQSQKFPDLMPVGTLILKVEKMHMTLPNTDFFAILKHGPHWLRSRAHHSGKDGHVSTAGLLELRLPIYDMSDPFIAVCFVQRSTFFKVGAMGKPADVYPFCRTISPLAGMPWNQEFSRRLTTPRMYKEDGTMHVWAEGENGYATHTVQLRLKIVINDKMRLVKSYLLRPRRPPAWYTLGLDDADEHLVEKQYRKIITRWLASCSSPLPPACVKVVLANEREAFRMDVLKTNWARLVSGLHWLLLLRDGLNHIMTWDNTLHSASAYCLLCGLCFWLTPTLSVLLGTSFLVMFGHRPAIYGGKPPARASIVEAVDEEQDGALEAPAGNHNPYAELKRKYDEVVGLGLTVQNLLDDAACFVERLQSMHNWSNALATKLFTVAVGLATLVIYLLGVPLVLCVILLWVLRPPFLRDPEPNLIENYFWRLPTQQSAACAARLKQVDNPID